MDAREPPMSFINPRKRSRSPERTMGPLPPIHRSFDDRRGPSYPPQGPTSAPRFSETSSPSVSSPSHFANRTPPQGSGFAPPPPPPVRQTQQSLPSLSEALGGASPSPLKPLIAPAGLTTTSNHHHSYSTPGSQTTSPHPSNPDQRPRPYEQTYGTRDVYVGGPQYSHGYSSEPPRSEPTGGRYQPSNSPLTPMSGHASLPYSSAPQYPHDSYRNSEPHFMKKENGMSMSIPPYGPNAEKALVFSALKHEAQYLDNTVYPALKRFSDSVYNLEREGSVHEVAANISFLSEMAARLSEMASRASNEVKEYEIRCQHANMTDQRIHPQSQPPRGSPYQYSKSVDEMYEEQKRYAQPDQKRARRGRAAPPGRCHSCNRSETPEWRRGPDGARTLCNACGLHFAKISRKNQKNAVAASS